jgi:hypothetical protein
MCIRLQPKTHYLFHEMTPTLLIRLLPKCIRLQPKTDYLFHEMTPTLLIRLLPKWCRELC